MKTERPGLLDVNVLLALAWRRRGAHPVETSLPKTSTTRIVLAVDIDFPSSTRSQGPLLKDRLFIGYQENLTPGIRSRSEHRIVGDGLLAKI